MKSLKIRQLGPINDAEVKLGDITVLVGPQASGKSLFIQMLNLVLDYPSIIKTLKSYGATIKNVEDLLAHYLGPDMAKIWKEGSEMIMDGKSFDLGSIISKRPRHSNNVAFYIPAQRVLIMEEGWPRPFLSLNSYPYVVRKFSEGLRLEMETGLGKDEYLFPKQNRLKSVITEKFQKSIFRNSVVKLETEFKKRLVLEVNGKQDMQLPISFWSAGQREFMPLLLGLFFLCPPSKVRRKGYIETVIIEELEMGLHPEAINDVMFAIMELISRGYRVILSTHSLHVVEMIWALEEMKKSGVSQSDKIKAFSKLFNVDITPGVKKIAANSLKKDYNVFYFKPEEENGQSITRDITSLDPSEADTAISGWGGLTEFSSNVADVVSGLHENESVDSEE
ncbi:MAG: AAA family ATPase [Candidatus Omnitrophota bacterium]